MTKIKLCGITRECEIDVINEIKPEYIGFVFVQNSRRCVTIETAAQLKRKLCPDVQAVGVFVDERQENVAALLNEGVIDIAQLHGGEDERYIRSLKAQTGKPVIKAFRMETKEDVSAAENCPADLVLLDAGNGGTGTTFDWRLLEGIRRPYFLAGGLCAENVGQAVEMLHPAGVDVSSGIETDGVKDKEKMRRFVSTVRARQGFAER